MRSTNDSGAVRPRWPDGQGVEHSARVFTVPGLMTADECDALVAEAERRGFDAASVRTASGPLKAPRFYKYSPGRFKTHKDGSWSEVSHTRRLRPPVYLNDGFTGGETDFRESKVVPGTGQWRAAHPRHVARGDGGAERLEVCVAV